MLLLLSYSCRFVTLFPSQDTFDGGLGITGPMIASGLRASFYLAVSKGVVQDYNSISANSGIHLNIREALRIRFGAALFGTGGHVTGVAAGEDRGRNRGGQTASPLLPGQLATKPQPQLSLNHSIAVSTLPCGMTGVGAASGGSGQGQILHRISFCRDGLGCGNCSGGDGGGGGSPILSNPNVLKKHRSNHNPNPISRMDQTTMFADGSNNYGSPNLKGLHQSLSDHPADHTKEGQQQQQQYLKGGLASGFFGGPVVSGQNFVTIPPSLAY